MTALHEYSACDLREKLRAGEVRPTELTEHYLGRIADHRELGAFVTVTPELARQRAADLEASGPRPDQLLWGLPHGDKDLAYRVGVPTYFGSAAVKAFMQAAKAGKLPAQAASVVQAMASQASDPVVQLADNAGLVSLGKTNTPEFGLYSHTETAVAPPAVHPLDHTLGAGGSSGGAAVAVASGLLPLAIGSDGGGSVRIPAATVGIVGLKPTLGAVPIDRTEPEAGGVVSGPLARTARDAAMLFEVMTGSPERAMTDAVPLAPASLRVGFAIDSPWNPTYDFTTDERLLTVLGEALGSLGRLGHRVTGQIGLADADYGKVFLRSWQMSASHVPSWLDVSLMHPVTQWLVEEGRNFSADDFAANLADKEAFAARCAEKLADVDVMVTPALGMPPVPVGWYSDDPETNFEQQCRYTPYTSFVNVLGWPAITVPVGTIAVGERGGADAVIGDSPRALPAGIQIIGKPGDDLLLLRLAHQIESLHA